MSKKRDHIRILSVQSDCDGHTEKAVLDAGFHTMEIKTVNTPCDALTALNNQRFDCVVAMTPPSGAGVTELARNVTESFGLPFLYKVPTQCDSRKISCVFPLPETTHAEIEHFCHSSETDLTPELKSFPGEEAHLPMLPDYPKVSAIGRMVTILWGKEKQEFWGEEESEGEAAEVAAEMENELRAASYVTSRLLALMGNLNDELIDIGIGQKQVENALWDGYRHVLGTFAALDNRD